jgi:5-hydroxyisourate hydrolase
MISTHVLDTSLGNPAAGVSVTLEKKSGENWSRIGQDMTNQDGRIVFQAPYEAGTYRLLFQTDAYFAKNKIHSFFTLIPVLFEIKDTTRKYHVPLLLNPYGYSTYRGS